MLLTDDVRFNDNSDDNRLKTINNCNDKSIQTKWQIKHKNDPQTKISMTTTDHDHKHYVTYVKRTSRES